MPSLKMLIRYLDYMFRARGPFRLHSPYVFQFYQKVLKGKTMPHFPAYCRDMRMRLPEGASVFLRELSQGLNRRRGLHSIARKESVSKRDAAILFRLAHFLRAKNVLELGTCLGYSAICLASGAPGAKVWSIDGDRGRLEIARRRALEAGFSGIAFKEGRFRDVLPTVLREQGPFELVFIDGDHKEEETLYLAEQIRPSLSSNGVMVIHDIHHSAAMRRAWHFLNQNPEYSLSISTFSMGFLFVSSDFQKQYIPIRM
jgi:predicted O-methyltransferase YrrM